MYESNFERSKKLLYLQQWQKKTSRMAKADIICLKYKLFADNHMTILRLSCSSEIFTSTLYVQSRVYSDYEKI